MQNNAVYSVAHCTLTFYQAFIMLYGKDKKLAKLHKPSVIPQPVIEQIYWNTHDAHHITWRLFVTRCERILL